MLLAIAGGAGVRTRLSGSKLLNAGHISVGFPTAELRDEIPFTWEKNEAGESKLSDTQLIGLRS